MNKANNVLYTPMQAYIAMVSFIMRYYYRGYSDAIGMLITKMQVTSSGHILTKQYADFWKEACCMVIPETPIEELTNIQAFNTMKKFFEIYGKNHSCHEDILGIVHDMRMLKDGSTANPATWEVWNRALDHAVRYNYHDI